MAPSQALEVEKKFSVGADSDVPDLSRIAGVVDVTPTAIASLSAVYYDTDDLTLTRLKITLRRRTGGKDAGWHIKLPTKGGRVEVQFPLGDTPEDGQLFYPPEEIAELLHASLRGRQIKAIAQVDNERHTTVMLGENDVEIAEFCDDHVTAYSFLPGGQRTAWREWECELASDAHTHVDPNSFLLSATEILTHAGASQSPSPSKLSAALGDSYTPQEEPYDPNVIAPHSPAAAVVTAVATQRDALAVWDPATRVDAWDSVHQLRVATRQLRSQLDCFAGIVDPQVVKPITKELKKLATILGRARDAEVVEEELTTIFAQLDHLPDDDEAITYVLEGLRRTYKDFHKQAIDYLNSSDYLKLLESIDELVANPPLVDPEFATAAKKPKKKKKGKGKGKDKGNTGAQHATAVLFEHLSHAYSQVVKDKKLVDKLEKQLPESRHDYEEAVHTLRKTAKKFRYSVGAVASLDGVDSSKLASRLSSLQDILGHFQDSVTIRDHIRTAATEGSHKIDTFSLGVAYEWVRADGYRVLGDLDEALAKVGKSYKKLAAEHAPAK